MSTEINLESINEEEDTKSSSSLFFAAIKERYCLNPFSEKKTYHLVLDLAQSDGEYSVGDCIGIYPQNDFFLVEKILNKLRASGNESIKNRQGNVLEFRHFLQNSANLNRIPQKLGGEKNFLNFLSSTNLSIQEICDSLLPMLPRYYSIASSMSVVKKEAHLTVALSYNDSDSPSQFGTCSHFLCYHAPLEQFCIPVFLKRANHFSLPPESFDKPLIMVGPGTGVAPFRGFMQERFFRQASPDNWLFFGERNFAHDFYYKDYWDSLTECKFLQLECAFSRDQEQKIYVQHKMLEFKTKVWQWLEKGAYLYVCGDAKHMARDVEKTLHHIIETEGNLDASLSKNYLRNLKKLGRYRKDVY